MELNKNLNLIDVFGICTGAMLSGLFILPGLGYEIAGPSLLLSYLLAGLIATTGLISQAELVSAMPKAGGTYFYVTRSMGTAVGTIYGLITWFSLTLKSAYQLVFMAAFVKMAINMNLHLIATLLCLSFIIINLIGVKEAGRFQLYLVIGIVALLIYFCLFAYHPMNVNNLTPFSPHGINGIITAAGFVFISFGGLLKVASIAEEVKNPGRVIPLGMILSMIATCIIYLVVIFVMVAILGPEIAGSKTPVSDAADKFLPHWNKAVFSIAAILAIAGSVNAGVLSSSRYPLAMARDEMLPEFLGRINEKFKTPHTSIYVTGLTIILALFVDINVLVKAASCVLILTFIFSCLAVVILRESRIQNYQPQFKTPLYPWIQLFGSIGFAVLLFGLGLEAMLTSCGMMLLGFIIFWFYGRKKARREYALLHLIERITARELTSHLLETELKEIIHHRDEILKDRFDHLIEECPVLDIESSVSMEEFFAKTSQALSEDLNLAESIIYTRLMDREKESSTVLMPYLAIPHIIVEGEKRFDILLARCKEGIVFSEQYPEVHTVFVLIGSKDERPFHLNALAAIAQIVQDDNFEERWMSAKNTEGLRDIVLLGKRKRQT